MKELRIVFMGTPDFAVESLRQLVENNFNIVGVITAPDKPKGRGRKLSFSPVKEYALSKCLKILQPTNLKSDAFVEELRSLNANLQVVVAFRMLPEVVWSMPEYGTFNLHASLLPQYRGAAPINWAVINGDTETGVTTFFIRHEIDTGNIIFQEKEPIFPDDTAGSLHDRLMVSGAVLVVKTVQAIENDAYQLRPQNSSEELMAAPKIFKEDCRINWDNDADSIYNFIRGLSPYPAAWTTLNGVNYKLLKTRITDPESEQEPGAYTSDEKSFLTINCKKGTIGVLEIQMEGKKRMSIEEFLRGNKI